MERNRQEQRVGGAWITAMILLVILLVLGIFLYLQMTAPLHGPGRRATGVRQYVISRFQLTGANVRRVSGYNMTGACSDKVGSLEN